MLIKCLFIISVGMTLTHITESPLKSSNDSSKLLNDSSFLIMKSGNCILFLAPSQQEYDSIQSAIGKKHNNKKLGHDFNEQVADFYMLETMLEKKLKRQTAIESLGITQTKKILVPTDTGYFHYERNSNKTTYSLILCNGHAAPFIVEGPITFAQTCTFINDFFQIDICKE